MQPQVSKYEKVLKREKKASAYMIQMYCGKHHKGNGELCPECVQLKEYFWSHLEKCPDKEKKSCCGRCGLRCYPLEKREEIMKVMGYAGPRMLTRHPMVALKHLWDTRREPGQAEEKQPQTSKNQTASR